MSDWGAKLRRADALAARDEIGEAVRIYAEVARAFRSEGLLLRAVAVWRQVRDVIRDEGESGELQAEARAELIALYRELGLEADARALESEKQSALH